MKSNFLCLLLFSSVAIFCSDASTKKIQYAHKAGSWYPADPIQLKKDINYYFALAEKLRPISEDGIVSALIVPHAGYYFSGLCAAQAYLTIKNGSYDRVIVLGPSHKKNFNGIALPDYNEYKTPLGNVLVDKKAVDRLHKHSLFQVVPGAYQEEHSIEVELPFLQVCLHKFELVPLFVGNLTRQDFKEVAQAVSVLLNDDKKTIIVVSSDFIHYGKRFGYTPSLNDAIKFDSMATDAICSKSYKEFDSVIQTTKATICGKNAIKILLQLIEMGSLGEVACQRVCYYNSAQIEQSYTGKTIDIAKLEQKVSPKSFVSYAGIVFRSKLTKKEQDVLLTLARNAITKKLFPKKKIKDEPFLVTENLKKPAGSFVTIKKNGRLRGCIGRIISDKPLYEIIPDIAQSSAFNDSRFSPLTKEEFDDISISISVLSPPKIVKSYKNIVLGKHGIILKKTVEGVTKSSVYLPQVAPEQGWNLTQTLESLSQKAGLKKDAWKEGAQFSVFEGFEFEE